MLIYKATNKINGKVYIGQTSQSLEQRIQQHKSKSMNCKDNYHFHNALRKYGIDNFIFEVVEDNIKMPEQLNEREKYWIKYYDSYENGYNSTRGGDGSVKRDDELILKLFIEGKNTKEISRITGYNRSTIYKSFQNLNLSEENNKRKIEENKKRCSYPVLQYDLEGNFIREWESATECGKHFGNQTLISAVCNQKESVLSGYGYLFKYKNDNRDISEWVSRYKNKKTAGKPKKRILQLNENNDIINIYESGAEAARALGKKDKSNICAAARKGVKAYGFYWKYD